MNSMIQRIVLIGLSLGILLFGGKAWSEDISLTASVDKTTLRLDEKLVLTLTIQGTTNVSFLKPTLPVLEGFDILNSSQSSEFSIISGAFSATKNIRYDLLPREKGTWTIAPATLSVKGKVLKTKPITVTVLPGSTPASSTPPVPKPQPSPSPPMEKLIENIHIETSVDRHRVYTDQQITLTFSFYNRLNLWKNPTYTPPTTVGFLVEDLPQPKRRRQVVVKGRRYEFQEIKYALFPTTPGTHTIGSATLRYRTDPFSGREATLTTDPIEIEVIPLPGEGQPRDFHGAVGDYTLSMIRDRSEVAVNEPVTVTLAITGKGNINSLPEPTPPLLENCKSYTSQTSENISREGVQISGKKSFQYLLVPTTDGKLSIGPYTFSYFNPEDEQYHTLSTEPFIVTVSPSTLPPSVVDLPWQKQVIDIIGSDIHPIRLKSSLKSQSSLLFQRPLFLWLLFLPLGPVLLILGVQTYQDRIGRHPERILQRRAKVSALKRLKNVKTMSCSTSEYCSEISKALLGYFRDKGNFPVGLSGEELLSRLRDKGLSQERTDLLKDLVRQCDAARFSPQEPSSSAKDDLLQKARHIIKSSDKEWK